MAIAIDDQTKLERGRRIREIRESWLRMSRRAFADKYKIPYPTLQNWEDGRFGGLSQKGAEKLANYFFEEGIRCDANWLLYGEESNSEKPKARQCMYIDDYIELDDTSSIFKELEVFYKHHKNAVHTTMTHNMLHPMLSQEDVVAGIRYDDLSEPNDYLNQFSIVKLHTGQYFIGQVVAVDEQQKTVTVQYSREGNKRKKIDKHEVLYIAPIIWMRKMSTE